MSAPDRPTLCLVIPNYNGLRHLSYSLESLLQTTYQPLCAVMVDNCSVDASCAFVAGNYPQVTVLKNPKMGFAASVNVGIRWARAHGARYVAVCNNDIRVPAQIFESAVDRMNQDTGIAIVGFTEVFRSQATAVSMPSEVRFADVGAALPGMLYLCRTATFETVGEYDEFYYMYGEEADLFNRIVRSGHRIFMTNIPVWHYVGASSKLAPLRIAWFSYRNDIRFIFKNKGLPHILRRLLVLFYYAVVPAGRLNNGDRDFKIKLERFRLGNMFSNVLIYCLAILWNVVFLPHTMCSRLYDSFRIRRSARVLRGAVVPNLRQ